MFICKNKQNIGKICQIRRTVNLFVKLRQKCRSPGVYLERWLEVRRSPRQSFIQSGAIYCRIWLWGAPTAGGALRIGGKGHRMNSKIKIQTNKAKLDVC
jgi:hypothetical protein